MGKIVLGLDEDDIQINENDQHIRYRCEQVNVTKIGGVPSFHSDIRKEYKVSFNKYRGLATCKLEDYVFDTEPKDFEYPLEEMKDLEFAKDNVLFRINEDGTIAQVLNFKKLKERWEEFRGNFVDSSFYRDINDVNPKAAKDILEVGDQEFSEEHILRETYNKNLVYHILFKDYRESNTDDELSYLSQIFHNMPMEVTIQHSKIREDDIIVQYRSVGNMDRSKLNISEMIRQYNELYKPTVRYNFTEYNYEYRIRREVNKKTGMITLARAVLIESIKNNYELISQLELKQVNL